MAIERYRVKDTTIAISQEQGKGVAHTVAVGTIVELCNGPLDGDRLVEVVWNGKIVMMFTQDLRYRAELVRPMTDVAS